MNFFGNAGTYCIWYKIYGNGETLPCLMSKEVSSMKTEQQNNRNTQNTKNAQQNKTGNQQDSANQQSNRK